MAVTIAPGNTYLIEEKKPDKIFRAYRLLVDAGFEVICVTRVHPERLEEDYGIPPENIIWLSNSKGFDSINPQDIGLLNDRLVRYYDKDGKQAALMEGLEYLLMHNDFKRVLDLVNYLYESVVMESDNLLISIDPRAFDTRELALMERVTTIVSNQGIEIQQSSRRSP